jgi:signal transduction histidine kinase
MMHFLKYTRFVLLFVCCITSNLLHSQTPTLDSLRQLLKSHPQKDTVRVNLLNNFGLEARKGVADDALNAYTESLELSRTLGYKKGEATSLLGLGFHHRFMGETKLGLDYSNQALQAFQEIKDTAQLIACYYNLVTIYSLQANYEMAIKVALEGLKLAELVDNSKWLILMNYQMGEVYMRMNDPETGGSYYSKSLKIAEAVNNLEGMHHAYSGLGWKFEFRQQLDSALYYYGKQYEIFNEMNEPRGRLESTLNILQVKEKLGQYKEVFDKIYPIKQQFIQLGQVGYLPFIHNVIANAHLHTGNADSALYYAFLAQTANKRSGRVMDIGYLNQTIAQAYAMKNNFKEAYKYQVIFSNYMDSLNITDAVKRGAAQKFSFDLDKKQSQISLLTKNEELVRKQNRQQQIILASTVAGLLLLVGLSIVLVRNNRSKQKAYNRLEQQQAALKATQAQLIQSEKMASLGELTAGIAHEIQNPLNFVNNFSDLNKELLNELKEEIKKGNIEEVNAIADDVIGNEEKINHHGKRADGIVKGMLQHSRTTSSTKEPTDINKLADEYLRLAYHGLRAKDKSFNATLKTDFDESIGNINIVPQDIGRVILNLITNAFYVVDEKKALRQAQGDIRQAQGDSYEPTVTVSTKKMAGKVLISVSDNGNGIPPKVLEKIFQPFFTTKPTGQGTGLGLSLAYDIIKAHGGELKVETKEGEGSAFIIQLAAA